MEMQPVDLVIAAVLEGDEARVAELVRLDPGLVVARNMFGVSPLHAAHYTRRDDLLAPFVPEGALDFGLVAELGRLDIVRNEVAARPEGAREYGVSGSTPLHGACYWGQVDIARVCWMPAQTPPRPRAIRSFRSRRSVQRSRPRRASRSRATTKTSYSRWSGCCSSIVQTRTGGAATG